jgi:tight adherence protein C
MIPLSIFAFDPLLLVIFNAGLVFMGIIYWTVLTGFKFFTEEESVIKVRLNALRSKEEFGSHSIFSLSERIAMAKEKLAIKVEPISVKLYGKNPAYLAKVGRLLGEAGLPDTETAVKRYITMRVVAGVVIGALCFIIGFAATLNIKLGMGGLCLGGMLGSALYEMRIKWIARGRRNEIRYTLPDTLDLMVVCVEAGLSLDATLQRVADETTRLAPEFSKEIKRCLKELNAGITRHEVFQNLGQRTNVDELRSLCAMLIQTDKLGTSIGDTLRIFSDDMRVRRKQRAEEQASKASIKMTFPLVLLIFPPLFIVLLGPVVLKAMDTFFK